MGGADLLLVRATVNLAGLRAGEIARVDPADSYMVECLDASWLVPLAAPRAELVQESPGGAPQDIHPVGG